MAEGQIKFHRAVSICESFIQDHLFQKCYRHFLTKIRLVQKQALNTYSNLTHTIVQNVIEPNFQIHQEFRCEDQQPVVTFQQPKLRTKTMKTHNRNLDDPQATQKKLQEDLEDEIEELNIDNICKNFVELYGGNKDSHTSSKRVSLRLQKKGFVSLHEFKKSTRRNYVAKKQNKQQDVLRQKKIRQQEEEKQKKNRKKKWNNTLACNFRFNIAKKKEQKKPQYTYDYDGTPIVMMNERWLKSSAPFSKNYVEVKFGSYSREVNNPKQQFQLSASSDQGSTTLNSFKDSGSMPPQTKRFASTFETQQLERKQPEIYLKTANHCISRNSFWQQFKSEEIKTLQEFNGKNYIDHKIDRNSFFLDRCSQTKKKFSSFIDKDKSTSSFLDVKVQPRGMLNKSLCLYEKHRHSGYQLPVSLTRNTEGRLQKKVINVANRGLFNELVEDFRRPLNERVKNEKINTTGQSYHFCSEDEQKLIKYMLPTGAMDKKKLFKIFHKRAPTKYIFQKGGRQISSID